MASNVKHF